MHDALCAHFYMKAREKAEQAAESREICAFYGYKMAAQPASLAELGQKFVEWDVNPETRALAQAILSRGDEREMRAAFGGRLEFGTAGLRGPMGAGFTRMNELTVIQAAQGLINYLETTGGELSKSQGIVIGYDHRAQGSLTSKRFAHLTAVAGLLRGFRIYLYDRLVCTPMVPFGILKKGAAAGVMVTASHNPKEDNGYKVYGPVGAQIISPVDQHISAAIASNLAPWDPAAYVGASEETIRGSGLCGPNDTAEVIDTYLSEATAALCRHPRENGDASLPHVRVCYTAMHGVGTPFTTALMQRFGLAEPTLTVQQVQPDAGFPTVAFPNPEEGKGALSLAMAAADAAGCTLILANDPDADRLAVAEWLGGGGGWTQRTPGTAVEGEWRVFTGNEIATLLAHWIWVGWQELHPGGPPSVPASQQPIMIASTVSSKMLQAMGRVEGFTFQETLTGFKWMGSAMADHESSGTGRVIFAFEEAIGFAVWGGVRDKDGVTAAAVFAEMACALARAGSSCASHLDALSSKYKAHVTSNGYIYVDEPAKTEAIFKRLRTEFYSIGAKVGDLSITACRDLTGAGWDSEGEGGRPSLPVSSGTQMLTYKFSNSVVATLRTSGTEPKLKYYCEGCAGVPGDANCSSSIASTPLAVRAETVRTVRLILDEMLRPEVHGLKRPVVQD